MEEDKKDILDEKSALDKIDEEEQNILKEEKEENLENNKDDILNEEIIEEKHEKNVNEEEEKKEDKAEIQHKNKKSKKVIIVSALILVVILLLLSTIFALINMNNDKIIKGVYIEKIDISNYSKEKLEEEIESKIENIEQIEMNYEDYSAIIKLEELGIKINKSETIKNASKIGKSNNIIKDNYSILKANIFKTKIDLEIEIEEEEFNEMIDKIQVEIPGAVKEYYYDINEKELLITAGKEGKAINKEELKEKIVENIKEQFNGNNEIVNIPTEEKNPKDIDIEGIYSEIYKEAKDAYIIEEPLEVHKEEQGIDFDITIEEAKEMLKEKKERYTIPLKINEPQIKLSDLGDKIFKQTLSKYTTIYDAGNTNRASNIALAASTINDTILLPGETFSYNGIIGNTTKEKGYKLGGAYVQGKVVQAYGGGICQVSTTLYNAVLYANLEIVERHNHSYAVSYVPAGRDATVSYGGKDFKFKNSRTYPIKISANAKNGVVSISILGLKEETEYEIELTSSTLSTNPCQVTYENTNALEEGKQKTIQTGHNGLSSVVYRIVKLNGRTISKDVLSKDTYLPMNKIVQVGTARTNTSAVNTPTPIKETPNASEIQKEPTETENSEVEID